MPDWIVTVAYVYVLLAVVVSVVAAHEGAPAWRALVAIFDRAWELLTWPIRQLTPRRTLPTPVWCACRGGDRGELVPVESVVTGEVLTHRCPTCWLPRPTPPSGSGGVSPAYVPPVMALPTSCAPGEHTPTLVHAMSGQLLRAVCDDCGRDLPLRHSDGTAYSP